MKITLRNPLILFLSIIFLSSTIYSCSWSNLAKGGSIGAAAGSALGGVIGNKAGSTVAGVLIGAAVGGAAGALIGRYMDKQAEEIEQDLEGATVERVGEGIKITFDSGLLFPVNQDQLTYTSRQNLLELAAILNKYEDTNILIEGHTDASGTDAYNHDLSQRRAYSVFTLLSNANVDLSRMNTIAYGESQPLTANDTEYGRQQNRRVEVAVFANDKLKKAAERGQVEVKGQHLAAY